MRRGLALLLACSSAATAQQEPLLEQRAAAIVARMTLDEKAGQLRHKASAIRRLNIPAYNWWSEGLHGVARAGTATVFPQAIGLAATFDASLIGRVADTIGTEFRAKYVERRLPDGGSEGYRGLTVWSPNINIFRDPRWGRGQETFGEDPFLRLVTPGTIDIWVGGGQPGAKVPGVGTRFRLTATQALPL